MAKDPAFLFYDGDAARDVSHMNRLERGCYFDLIQAQRKFHGITLEQVRKVLGNDFEACWPALELILVQENNLFYIDWVRESTRRRAIHSELQRQRIMKRWEKNHGITTVLPTNYLKANESNHANATSSKPTNTTNTTTYNKLLLDTFEDLWSQYPKRVGKKDALKHFKATIAAEADIDGIWKALQNYKNSERVSNGYIQNGSTWFNNWRDWVDFEEKVCEKCHGKGKYTSTTGYEVVCSCPRGKKA